MKTTIKLLIGAVAVSLAGVLVWLLIPKADPDEVKNETNRVFYDALRADVESASTTLPPLFEEAVTSEGVADLSGDPQEYETRWVKYVYDCSEGERAPDRVEKIVAVNDRTFKAFGTENYPQLETIVTAALVSDGWEQIDPVYNPVERAVTEAPTFTKGDITLRVVEGEAEETLAGVDYSMEFSVQSKCTPYPEQF